MANDAKDVADTDISDPEITTAKGETGHNKSDQAGLGSSSTDISESDAIAEEVQRKQRELPPLRYCRFIAENPKLAFGKESTLEHVHIIVAF